MAPPAMKHPSDQDWDSKRGLLERLYLTENKSMLEVMSQMKRDYGWEAKRNQYEKWLTREWKLCKNVDSSRWKALYPHLRDMKRAGKRAEILIDGKKKSPSTIDKEMRRQLRSDPEMSTALPCELPKGVILRQGSFTSMPRITTDLPFHSFESCTYGNLPIRTYEYHSDASSRVSRKTSTDTGIWNPAGGIEEALQLVVPRDQGVDESSDFSIMTPDTQFFASPLDRSILFSVANNFAGLGAFPQEKVIEFLQRETSEGLYLRIRAAPHHYTIQAIALNLFRASIEVGDARIVNFLIGESLPGIQVNEFVCSYRGRRYTALERAAALLHKSVVKTLLDHGADVNLSHPNVDYYSPKGALNCAAMGMEGSWKTKRVVELDPELFKMLVEAGGELEQDTLESLIQYDDKGDFVRLIVSTHVAKRHQKWSESGIFRRIFKYQEHDTLLEILDIMLKHHADLNFHMKNGGNGSWPRRVIDVVAGRGDLVLMKRLLDAGAQWTGDTLPCAISSGNEDLFRCLVDLGAPQNSMGSLQISPLAAAIRLQRREFTDLIVSLTDPASLSDRGLFQSALKAASEVGDLKWIEHLVETGGEVRPQDLGIALMIATRDGRQDAALALIDAGADTNVDSDSIPANCPALLQALRQHNPVLVRALLNADANPNYDRFRDTFSRRQPAIELAVRWGNIDIVREIIHAGANINDCCHHSRSEPALNIAVKRKDQAMVDLLLHAGYDVNNPRVRLLHTTALRAVVETGDLNMIRHILRHGADPHDPYALAEATKQDVTIFELLLHEHAVRYPKGRQGWGTGILNDAIDSGDFTLFKRLLNGGADANQAIHSTTPFGYAISRPQGTGIKFVEYLLQQKRKTNCSPQTIVSTTRGEWIGDRSYVRVTALLAAIGTKNRSMVELLLRHGADVNFPAELSVKRTPLQRATELGSMELIQLLLERGAEVNGPAAQREGGTALQFAALNGHVPIARLFLENGADVDAPASKVDGKTALEGAAWEGRLDMVAVLLKAGAGRGGSDQGQFARAMAFAEENGHGHITRLLNDYVLNGMLSNGGQDPCEELFNFDLYQVECGSLQLFADEHTHVSLGEYCSEQSFYTTHERYSHYLITEARRVSLLPLELRDLKSLQ